MGINDKGEEGMWRFPGNSENFDPKSDGSLFGWDSGEPNNDKGAEDCALVRSNMKLNDGVCGDHWFHGLCEVKVYDC